jgi:hypothetical protein
MTAGIAAVDLAAARATIVRWRFYEAGRYLGGLGAEPGETAEQARKRFLRICPVHKGRELTVEGSWR